MMMAFCGIPASGKSTVLRETLTLHPSVKVLNYGELMLEAAGLSEAERDQIRKRSAAEMLNLSMQAAKLAAEQAQGLTILDIHALVRSPDAFIPGLPKKVLDILSISSFVSLECDAQCILERRQRDASRSRDVETLDEIKRHQELNRAFLIACSMYCGAPLSLIDNSHNPQEAAQHLRRILTIAADS